VRDEIAPENLFDPRGNYDEIASKSPAAMAQMKANSETGELFNAEKLREKFPESVILEDWGQAVGKRFEI
jgi:hypothetical protein